MILSIPIISYYFYWIKLVFGNLVFLKKFCSLRAKLIITSVTGVIVFRAIQQKKAYYLMILFMLIISFCFYWIKLVFGHLVFLKKFFSLDTKLIITSVTGVIVFRAIQQKKAYYLAILFMLIISFCFYWIKLVFGHLVFLKKFFSLDTKLIITSVTGVIVFRAIQQKKAYYLAILFMLIISFCFYWIKLVFGHLVFLKKFFSLDTKLIITSVTGVIVFRAIQQKKAYYLAILFMLIISFCFYWIKLVFGHLVFLKKFFSLDTKLIITSVTGVIVFRAIQQKKAYYLAILFMLIISFCFYWIKLVFGHLVFFKKFFSLDTKLIITSVTGVIVFRAIQQKKAYYLAILFMLIISFCFYWIKLVFGHLVCSIFFFYFLLKFQLRDGEIYKFIVGSYSSQPCASIYPVTFKLSG